MSKYRSGADSRSRGSSKQKHAALLTWALAYLAGVWGNLASNPRFQSLLERYE